jgi:glycosyltransferase involved in cell wall biosynthesis
MITVFTPSFADEGDTNAQNLTVKEIVARLSPERFRVVMLHEAPPDPRIARRPNTRLIRWRRRGNTLRILARCLTDIPDVYFYPREGPLDVGFLHLRRLLRLKTAVVTHVVTGGLYREAPRRTLVRNIRQADAVLANSHYLSELVRGKLGVEAGTIHNGIDRRYFFPSDRCGVRSSGQPLTVLYAGSFRPYKRVDLLVRQAARWPQVQFHIAGVGEELQSCKNLAKQLGCANVEFVGHLTLQQLGDAMRGADIFFFPSDTEGHPQVLGQAAACGVPTVVMNAYRPDYVVNGETGFLAASDEELGQKLDLLIAQPELRASMGKAAMVHALKFNWDTATQQWQRVFEEVVAKRKRH